LEWKDDTQDKIYKDKYIKDENVLKSPLILLAIFVIISIMSQEFDLEFELESVVPRLEGLRSLIVYDSQYVVRSLIFYHIVPYFSPKKLFIAVYSDTMMRRIHRTYKSIPDENVASLLDNANIIKVGMHENTPFGNLYMFIDIRSDWWDELVEVLEKFNESSLLLFHGFSLLPLVYGDDAWRYMMTIFDALPDEITFINKVSSSLYNEEMKRFMERFNDVVIRIRREDDFLSLGGVHWIGVEQSIAFDVRPGYARYKIGEDGRLARI